MAETADHLPPPDPKVVATIASVLAQAPSDKIGSLIEKTLGDLYHAIRGRGWPHAETRRYVSRFGVELLEAIKASTLSTSGARLQ